MKETPRQQSLDAKIAESKRPFHGEKIIREFGSLHKERARTILTDLKGLEKWGVRFSPFLEIGAGSVQRSTALINDYGVEGVATDISIRSLQDTPYVLSLLGYGRKPTLICCDAHYLPFLADTFRFVFAYQTLHHFANPVPVVAECYRVLGRGGHFYFNEEPMDSQFRRFLRGNRVLAHPPTRLQRIGYRLGVEKLFWDDGKWERSLGMTEARFDIDLWRESLHPFLIIDVEVNRRLKFHSDLHQPRLVSLLSGYIGGNVKGVCRKIEGDDAGEDHLQRLMCLDCGSRIIFQEYDQDIVCANCGRLYTKTAGILRMFPKESRV